MLDGCGGGTERRGLILGLMEGGIGLVILVENWERMRVNLRIIRNIINNNHSLIITIYFI